MTDKVGGCDCPCRRWALAEVAKVKEENERLRAAIIPSPVRPEREIERENQRLREGLNALKARIEAALALHGKGSKCCYACESGARCETVEALKGEPEPVEYITSDGEPTDPEEGE